MPAPPEDRRVQAQSDRREMSRGGRRPYDLPGRYPPVLLADAYEGARSPCAAYLSLHKFEVAEAGTPAEALAIIDSEWMPQVILADTAAVASVAQRFASRPSWRSPAVILMAGYSEDPKPQVDGVLLKPFKLREMLETVRRVLR